MEQSSTVCCWPINDVRNEITYLCVTVNAVNGENEKVKKSKVNIEFQHTLYYGHA